MTVDGPACGDCPAEPIVPGDGGGLSPPGKIEPQTLSDMLDALRDDHRLRPLTSKRGEPVVLVKVHVAPSGQIALDAMAIPTDTFRPGGIEARTENRSAPPDLWIVVTSAGGEPVYWRGFPDPRRGVRVEQPAANGELTGTAAAQPDAVVAFRVPFEPDGQILIAQQSSPGSAAKRPLADLQFHADAPPLFTGHGVP